MINLGMIDKAFVNEKNKNEIVLKNQSGSAVVITIFDASGDFGAYNFLRSFENDGEIDFETTIALRHILARIESTDQFSLMNISTHSIIEFYLNN